jgi:hypothetical protein
MQAKVYDGIGPANVFSQYHSSIYVVVVFYSKYNTRSKSSLVLVASPTNPSVSVISNAIQVGDVWSNICWFFCYNWIKELF